MKKCFVTLAILLSAFCSVVKAECFRIDVVGEHFTTTLPDCAGNEEVVRFSIKFDKGYDLDGDVKIEAESLYGSVFFNMNLHREGTEWVFIVPDDSEFMYEDYDFITITINTKQVAITDDDVETMLDNIEQNRSALQGAAAGASAHIAR